MKEKILEILFEIFVILLIPVYLIIYLIIHMFSLIAYMFEPITEGLLDFLEEMRIFWKKFFKIGG